MSRNGAMLLGLSGVGMLCLRRWLKPCRRTSPRGISHLRRRGSEQNEGLMKTSRIQRLLPVLALLAAVPAGRVEGVPDNPLINGSFEDGLAGWDLSVSGFGVHNPFYVDSPPHPAIDLWSVPFIRDTLASQVEAATRFNPVDGAKAGLIDNVQRPLVHFFTLPDGRPGGWQQVSYTLSLSQTFDLPDGGTISGWSRFWTADWLPFDNDFASVTVNGTEVWKNSVAHVVGILPGVGGIGPWEPWSTTVGPGQYTISLNVGGDDQAGAVGVFDAIRVGAVPDAGSTVALLALSLLGIITLPRARGLRSSH